MLKKAVILLLAVFCLTAFSHTTYAGSFTQIADTGILNLGEDEKWEKSYNTSHGKFKIRFRKLFFGSDEKKYHLIIWWNDKRIADGMHRCLHFQCERVENEKGIVSCWTGRHGEIAA